MKEVDTRIDNHNSQVDDENKRNQFMLSLANSYNPHPQASAAVDFLGQELLNQEQIKPGETSRDEDGLPSNPWVRERAQIHAIDALAERGEGYEDLVDPRMAPNNGSVSLDSSQWYEFSENQEASYFEENGREPNTDPLAGTWDDVRNLEWPDDRDPDQKPELSETIESRGQSFDTPQSRVNNYVQEFQEYALD